MVTPEVRLMVLYEVEAQLVRTEGCEKAIDLLRDMIADERRRREALEGLYRA